MDDQPPAESKKQTPTILAEVLERRSGNDRRRSPERHADDDRRLASDRRARVDPEALLAELENRIAAALCQHQGSGDGNGSGWDKLIVTFR